jgi:hypothetical protein
MKRAKKTTRSLCIALAGAVVLLTALPVVAQVRQIVGAGAIRVKPPGELATIQRRDPDFTAIRFLSMQRSFRNDLRGKLLIGHAVVRLNRPIAIMQRIEWPPSAAQ